MAIALLTFSSRKLIKLPVALFFNPHTLKMAIATSVSVTTEAQTTMSSASTPPTLEMIAK